MPGRLIIAFIVSSLFTQSASSQERTPLTEHFVAGKIRIFYAIAGKSAVSLADANANSIPDHVEDVGKQIWATHVLLCGVLDFPDPFDSERYSGVSCIEVSIRDRTEMGGGNGVAFENSQRAKSIPEGNSEDRSLVMAIGKHVDARKNVTPAHEFFHLIQYSTTYFKNPWYLEGMARWSEHALNPDGVGDLKYSERGPWPQSAEHLSLLFDKSYDAEYVLWNPLARRADRRGLISPSQVPDTLRNLKYSDDTPVLRDFTLHGAPLMREILIELGNMDDVAYKELGYKDWSEDNQRSPTNNPYMYQAIMDVVRRQAPPVRPFSASETR